MHLQAQFGPAGLDRVLHQVEHGAHQGVAIAQQLAAARLALPTHLEPLDMDFGRRAGLSNSAFGATQSVSGSSPRANTSMSRT